MTAISLLFVITRWTMVAGALVQFVPVTEATFDSILLSHVSKINILHSKCAAPEWASDVLYYVSWIATACKRGHCYIFALCS